MKGAFITNRYYSDNGIEYAYLALKRAFGDIPLIKHSPLLVYDRCVKGQELDFDFAVFWDKDFYLAAAIEKYGIPVFNSPWTLATCDDKQKTYLALSGINIPKTVSAPLVYDVNTPDDTAFLQLVAAELGFPVIVKENTGSQGRQVYMAADMERLKELYQQLRHIPHHYQQLTGKFGSDIRIYTVGGKAIASCSRQGTDFKSNLAAGATVSLFEAGADYIAAAENISAQLRLDFGAVDFLVADSPVFLEVNSNAYFTGIERLGADIAGPIAAYIKSKLKIHAK